MMQPRMPYHFHHPPSPLKTAVVCCPEGYTADVMGGDRCYSNDKYYTFANATFTYNNTVVTAEVLTYTGTYPPDDSYSTTTTFNCRGALH
ncbi:hypothetical protein K456DRAFT_392358 [Colletotrichum gloeosporioides 23]|nr:hypothetical protein K456DRAFT_392358 [Colletotrichum gloeosporioides 23]